MRKRRIADSAFRVVNNLKEIIKCEDLLQGDYELTLSHYDRFGESERVTERLLINEPLSFPDNCGPSEKTYLYQGHAGTGVFFFTLEKASKDL